VWDGEQEKWFFSIIDVIAALTGNERPRKYWNDLKTKLVKEGSQLSDKIGQLKLPADDGKLRLTDVADTEQLFRLIQSIPSPKAEPFKLWLAQVASERMDEMADPEITIDRALEQYLRLGYSESWINQRPGRFKAHRTDGVHSYRMTRQGAPRQGYWNEVSGLGATPYGRTGASITDTLLQYIAAGTMCFEPPYRASRSARS
jgi:hypothetical protein